MEIKLLKRLRLKMFVEASGIASLEPVLSICSVRYFED